MGRRNVGMAPLHLLVSILWALIARHVVPVHGCMRSFNMLSKPSAEVEYYNPAIDSNPADDRVWIFAFDGRRKPYNFLDENGKLTGFDVDFVSQVCQIANKKCETVLTPFTECTISNRNIAIAGRGLMSGWFDGCPSYVSSVDRTGAVDFTSPYLATSSSFAVAPGNPSRFDPNSNDFSNFTIVHLSGAVTNAQCLNRLGKKFGNIVLADNLPDAKSILLSGKADVLFSPRTQIPDLEVLPQRVRCDDGGVAIMTKKGSELSSWWNPAFRKMVSTGLFAKICADSNVKYNEKFRCLLDSNRHVPPQNVCHDRNGKTWLFAVSGRRKPFNFLDDSGRLVGHDVDFVRQVCKVASQKCDVVLTDFTECGFTDRNINYAGRGIMDEWFDACTGYADSMDRRNNFDFTHAYLKSSSTFSVVPGNPSGFDPLATDLSAFTVTHLTGAYTNAACLNRLKKQFKRVVVAANLPEAKKLLLDGQANVLFSPRTHIPGLETFAQRYHCEATGTSMLTRKGSPLVTWWNHAFEIFVKSGEYQRQCKENSVKYNYTINCFSPAELNKSWGSHFFSNV